ncbi:hypothetical protein CPB86DRAFT_703033, partial [Serendipita vermifera]
FINLASGSNLQVGSGLKSCTADVTPTEPFSINGPKVILLDTPGFDDTQSSDYDILEEIANYMAKTYRKNKLLDGIIYLHSIEDRRMAGIAVRNLRLFESLCGDDPLKSVRVVTNKWCLLHGAEIGIARERELKEHPDYFGRILGGGATLMRHHDTKESSHAIISSLINQRDAQTKMAIQTEMVDDRLRLEETTGGRAT